MRQLSLLCLFIAGLVLPVQAQELLHYWHFNNSASGTPAWPSPTEASYSVGGGALTYTFDPTYVASFAGSTLNAEQGAGGGGSFVPQGGDNESNNGRHFDLHIPSTGYSNIAVSYATRGTGTGFDTHIVSYSIGGETFVELEERPANRETEYVVERIDLSGIAGVQDNGDLVVRITLEGASSNNGNNRFDNIAVHGYAAGANRPPAFTTALSDQDVDAEEEFAFLYDATDPDGDNVTFSLSVAPDGAAIDAETGAYTWTPSVEQGGRHHQVTAVASDGSISTSTTASLYVVAFPDNTAPRFTAALPDTIVRVGDELIYAFDAADDDGDIIALTLLDAPAGADFDTETNTLSWTVTTPGAYAVTVAADDGKETTVSDAVIGVRGLLFGGLEGEALREQLRAHYTPTQVLGYNDARDSMYAVLDLGDDGFVRGVYTGFGVAYDGSSSPRATMTAGGIDAEHTWPQSKGASSGNARSDLHHLFPSKSNVNSARGNLAFGDVTPQNTTRWFRGAQSFTTTPATELETYSRLGTQRFHPRDSHAGTAARAILYFFSIHEDVADEYFLAEQMQTVTAWSRDFIPTTAEVRRTYRISEWQGNVNPFVFDSTLAQRVMVDIEEPEAVSIGDARRLEDGEQVMVEGIVTRARGRYLRFQDDSGALTIFQSFGALNTAIANGRVASGDLLRVSGQMDTFNDMRQLSSISTFELVSRDNPLPEHVSLSFEELESNGGAYESMLVQVENFHIVADADAVFEASTTYDLTGDTGSPLDFDLRVQRDADSDLVGEPIPNGAVTFTGVLGRHYEDFQIEGIEVRDIQPYVDTHAPGPAVVGFEVSPAYPNPSSASVRIDITSDTRDHVRAELLDALGRRVAILHDAPLAAGVRHTLVIGGNGLSSGMYFLRVAKGSEYRQQSVVMVR